MTRYNMVSRVLLVAMLGASLGVGCKKGVAGVSGAAGQAMALLPKDVNIVFSIDLSKFRATKAWDSATKALIKPEDQANIDKVTKDCGINPLQDIDDILVGASGSPDSQKEYAVIVSGKNLGEKQVIDCANKEDANFSKDLTTEDYSGKKLYEKGGSDGETLVFPNDKTLVVAGSPAWAKKVLDLSSGKGDAIDKNSDLMAMVKKTSTDKAQVWAAGTITDNIKAGLGGLGGGADASALLAKIKGVYGSLDFSSGLAADINAVCTSEADAKSMLDKMNEGMQAAKGEAGAMGLDSIVNSVKFSQSSDTLKITVGLSQADLDKLVDMAKMFGGGMGGGGSDGMDQAPSSQP